MRTNTRYPPTPPGPPTPAHRPLGPTPHSTSTRAAHISRGRRAPGPVPHTSRGRPRRTHRSPIRATWSGRFRCAPTPPRTLPATVAAGDPSPSLRWALSRRIRRQNQRRRSGIHRCGCMTCPPRPDRGRTDSPHPSRDPSGNPTPRHVRRPPSPTSPRESRCHPGNDIPSRPPRRALWLGQGGHGFPA